MAEVADAFERAAQRTRQSVKPEGGRKEGWLTENPDFGVVLPRSPLDAAMMFAGGPVGGKLAKGAALLGAMAMDSDEAHAGGLSRLIKGIVDHRGIPIPGKAYEAAKKEATAAMASEPKGAGPIDLSGSGRLPDAPQFPLERYEPPRGVSERLKAALSNPNVQQGVSDTIAGGKEMGADKWYHTQAIRNSFIDTLGPEEGPKAFSKYMDYVAATSPRSDVPTNIRNASYYYMLNKNGEHLPASNPYPYGHVAQNLHRQNYGNLSAAANPERGWDVFANPKPASFSQNLQGNLVPVTADTHAFKNIGMRTEDPRFLATSFSSKLKPGVDPGADSLVGRFGEVKGDIATFRPQKLVESGRLSMDEAKSLPSFWDAQPNKNEYGAVEKLYSSLGHDHGLAPADAQAAAWAKGGTLTGLGSAPDKTFPELFNEQVLFTSKVRKEDPRDTLKMFIQGKKPLLEGAGAIGAGGAAAKGLADYAPPEQP